MFKKKSQLLILLVIIMLLFSTFCFATDTSNDLVNENARTATPNSEEGTTLTNTDGSNTIDGENPANTTNEDIYEDNLVIFDDNIKMDKLVDGNVYLFGNDIEITGKVNGNIFVFGNNVNFSNEAYIVNSAYVFANIVNFNGLCSDLNVATNKLTIPYATDSCFIFRDLNVCANSFTFAGGIGRNANIFANTFNFVKEENASGLIYGNLNYSSTNELELSADLVNGNISYSKIVENNNQLTTQEIIESKLVSLGTTLLYVIIVYLLGLLIAPKFVNKANAKLINILPALGIGILSIFAVAILFFALMFTVIGVHLGFVMLAIYILLFAIAFSVFAIYITNAIKPFIEKKIKLNTKWKFVILLVVVALIMWGLQQIPYINGFASLIILLSGIGLIFMSIFGNLKKESKPVATTDSTDL